MGGVSAGVGLLQGSLCIRRLTDGRALMARRSILMLDLVELLTHWHAGRSQVRLSESLGIDRKTVRKYTARRSPPVSSPVGSR